MLRSSSSLLSLLLRRRQGTSSLTQRSQACRVTSIGSNRCHVASHDVATSSERTFSSGADVAPRDLPYFHFGHRPRHPSPKFKSPRKRASKLFDEINKQAVKESKSKSPQVFETPFAVGDAIEMEVVENGGVAGKTEKIRGVVLGMVNRGLGSSVILRDVVFGEPIERKIPLHSPLVKSIKVLEKNFVFKGKRKVKRAKLYYLRDRLPQETRVTKW